jgi:cob(I)alamin adenosyltransferase
MTGPVSLRRSNGLRAGDIGGGTRNTKMMPKLTRIYTRAGDRGMTGLVGGRRVKKSAPRIATYGTLDELSSAIGVTRAALRPLLQSHTRAARLDGWLAWTQDVLFNLGTDLATLAPDRREDLPRVEAADAHALERAIDQAQCDLPPLATFIHPGGSLPGAYLHVARTICRRAERLVVALIDEENDVSPEALPYLNRLSDALFVWARWINDALHDTEYLWNPATRPPE